MSAYTRRSFLARTSAFAAAAAAANAFARDPLTKSNLGVQLYTVRNTITKDPGAVLKAIQDIGYTEVEATYANLDQIWPALKQTSLKPLSVHVDLDIIGAGGDKFDTVLGDLKQRGFEYVVAPYVPVNKRGGADMFKQLAATLNKAGERAKANGLALCYHNHAFEFKPLDGTPGFQILLEETQKDLVSLELDIFWVSVAGHDPVTILKSHGDRVALLHLKDKAAGLPTQFNEDVPHTTFKEVGNGSVDIPAVLAAAKSTPIRHYFVEQDQTPGDPIASLRQSFSYLSSRMQS